MRCGVSDPTKDLMVIARLSLCSAAVFAELLLSEYSLHFERTEKQSSISIGLGCPGIPARVEAQKT